MLIIAILLSFSCSSFSSRSACIEQYEKRIYNLQNDPQEDSKQKILADLKDDINILKSYEEVAKNIKENFPNLIEKNGNCHIVEELYKKLKDIIDRYKMNRNFKNSDKIDKIILDLDIKAKEIGNNASEIIVQLEKYLKKLTEKIQQQDNKSEEKQDDSKPEKDKKSGQDSQSELTVETAFVPKPNVSPINTINPINLTNNKIEEEKERENTPSQDTSSPNNIQIPRKMEEDLEKLARKYQGFDLKCELSSAEETVFKNRLSSIPCKVYPVIKIKKEKDNNGNNIYRILIQMNESSSTQPFKTYNIEN